MREILFRGFHQFEAGEEKVFINGEWVKGKWLCGFLSKTRNMDTKPCKLMYCIDFEEKGVMYSTVVIPETIGQYTGLKDKNGRKIFEDDIVMGSRIGNEISGVIVWVNEIASFGVIYHPRTNPTAWQESSILKNLSKEPHFEFDAKVIGNIHSNPGLLEGDE